ncbi:ATP-grasp domain-containing protein [Mycobacteroides abscessus]|uniref:ATP-grasp domain-containing protein n=1 Tax=Mycobacteroides abscessus TaxID=36809 RepID=UPI00192E4534|nr:ATP-grasp domain-containing protein [Mycobacteroides abscessus]
MTGLRIVTHKTWLADLFRPLGAVQDYGFDIDPKTALDTYWWAPGAWVASAYKAGVELPLLSCGPRWLDDLPMEYKGREVSTGWLGDWGPFFERETLMCERYPEVFVKLPEAKVDSFPARTHGTKYMRSNLAQYNLPDSTLVQIQGVMDFVTEARFFIAHGQITASSIYRHREWIWGGDNPPLPPLIGNKMRKMERFANLVLNDPAVTYPPGFVLDIGITDAGNPKVIEANAAWSSGPYDADPRGVLEAIKASHDFSGEHAEWLWRNHANPVWAHVGALKVVRSA